MGKKKKKAETCKIKVEINLNKKTYKRKFDLGLYHIDKEESIGELTNDLVKWIELTLGW